MNAIHTRPVLSAGCWALCGRCATIVALVVVAAGASSAQAPRVHATREPMKLDGRLDEAFEIGTLGALMRAIVKANRAL